MPVKTEINNDEIIFHSTLSIRYMLYCRKPAFLRNLHYGSFSVFLVSVRVKGGMSLRNGVWHGLRNDIIMRNIIYGEWGKEIN